MKVNETASVGTEVVALQTDDKDIGENARVSYTMISGNEKVSVRVFLSRDRLLPGLFPGTTSLILGNIAFSD